MAALLFRYYAAGRAISAPPPIRFDFHHFDLRLYIQNFVDCRLRARLRALASSGWKIAGDDFHYSALPQALTGGALRRCSAFEAHIVVMAAYFSALLSLSASQK